MLLIITITTYLHPLFSVLVSSSQLSVLPQDIISKGKFDSVQWRQVGLYQVQPDGSKTSFKEQAPHTDAVFFQLSDASSLLHHLGAEKIVSERLSQ